MTPEPSSAIAYLIDAWQRSILTLDVLRERGNEYLEHEKAGSPPVMRSRGELTPHQVERLRRVAALLGLDQPAQELKSA